VSGYVIGTPGRNPLGKHLDPFSKIALQTSVLASLLDTLELKDGLLSPAQ
jgi:hypothetical protein